jgi:hypothetical protein
MGLKRLSVKKEPHLRVHRYVVKIVGPSVKGRKTRYRYPMNRDEVRTIQKNLKAGEKMYVYSSSHNFEYGWVKEK